MAHTSLASVPTAGGENPDPTTSTSTEVGGDNQDSVFQCNICLDTAKDAVISPCGHLFCWPCIHQWLETRSYRQQCPVCKAGISKDKVIPLYGRGSKDQSEPRDGTPPRPQAPRAEPADNRVAVPTVFGFGHGVFQMSFGHIWTNFPFPGGTHVNNTHNGGPPPPTVPSTTPPHMKIENFLTSLTVCASLFVWVSLLHLY